MDSLTQNFAELNIRKAVANILSEGLEDARYSCVPSVARAIERNEKPLSEISSSSEVPSADPSFAAHGETIELERNRRPDSHEIAKSDSRSSTPRVLNTSWPTPSTERGLPNFEIGLPLGSTSEALCCSNPSFNQHCIGSQSSPAYQIGGQRGMTELSHLEQSIAIEEASNLTMWAVTPNKTNSSWSHKKWRDPQFQQVPVSLDLIKLFVLDKQRRSPKHLLEALSELNHDVSQAIRCHAQRLELNLVAIETHRKRLLRKALNWGIVTSVDLVTEPNQGRSQDSPPPAFLCGTSTRPVETLKHPGQDAFDIEQRPLKRRRKMPTKPIAHYFSSPDSMSPVNESHSRFEVSASCNSPNSVSGAGMLRQPLEFLDSSASGAAGDPFTKLPRRIHRDHMPQPLAPASQSSHPQSRSHIHVFKSHQEPMLRSQTAQSTVSQDLSEGPPVGSVGADRLSESSHGLNAPTGDRIQNAGLHAQDSEQDGRPLLECGVEYHRAEMLSSSSPQQTPRIDISFLQGTHLDDFQHSGQDFQPVTSSASQEQAASASSEQMHQQATVDAGRYQPSSCYDCAEPSREGHLTISREGHLTISRGEGSATDLSPQVNRPSPLSNYVRTSSRPPQMLAAPHSMFGPAMEHRDSVALGHAENTPSAQVRHRYQSLSDQATPSNTHTMIYRRYKPRLKRRRQQTPTEDGYTHRPAKHPPSFHQATAPSPKQDMDDPTGFMRSFRVRREDPCRNVLPVVLKKYHIADDWRNYSLHLVHGDQERCIGLDEEPIVLFKQLADEGRRPRFKLQKHGAPQDGSGAVRVDLGALCPPSPRSQRQPAEYEELAERLIRDLSTRWGSAKL